MIFSKTTTAALKTLISQTIASFGDRPATNAVTLMKVLPGARKLCADQYDAVIAHALRPMVRKALSQSGPAYGRAPPLIAGVELPYRISVPPVGMIIDADAIDDEAAIQWVVLHKATIAELARHVAMLDSHIAGVQTNRDRVYAVLQRARARTTDQSAIVGDVLLPPDAAAA